MKKILTKIFILFISSLLFAESFSFTPVITDIFTAREVSLGANYITDYSTFFSILSNPASAGLTGDKKLFPFISADMSGDVAETYDLIKVIGDGDETAMAEYISSMENAKTNIKTSGPICFGSIKNNFAFALFNSTYSIAAISGTDSSEIYGGEQFLLDLAYAYPIKLPGNTRISLGLGVRGLADVQGIFDGSFATALTNVKNSEMSFFPIYTTAGFGLDAGVTFSIIDAIIISVSWRDFFAATVTQKFNDLDSLKVFKTDYTANSTMPLESNLVAGIGFKIPLKKVTRNFLTTTNVFVQYSDLLGMFEDTTSVNYLETLAVGAEIEMFHTITLRFGMNNDYLGGGLGLKVGMIHLDAAIYSSKIGFTKNENGSLCCSISFGVYQ